MPRKSRKLTDSENDAVNGKISFYDFQKAKDTGGDGKKKVPANKCDFYKTEHGFAAVHVKKNKRVLFTAISKKALEVLVSINFISALPTTHYTPKVRAKLTGEERKKALSDRAHKAGITRTKKANERRIAAGGTAIVHKTQAEKSEKRVKAGQKAAATRKQKRAESRSYENDFGG